MHRVELKELFDFLNHLRVIYFKFLMHRVELKVLEGKMELVDKAVPNAPCGVERRIKYVQASLDTLGS